MIAVKAVVLAALVVALAVNAVAWQRGRQLEAFQMMTRQYGAQHSPGRHWQEWNSMRADKCADAPRKALAACLIIGGVAI